MGIAYICVRIDVNLPNYIEYALLGRYNKIGTRLLLSPVDFKNDIHSICIVYIVQNNIYDVISYISLWLQVSLYKTTLSILPN